LLFVIRLWRIVLFGLNQKEPKSSRPNKNLLKISSKKLLEKNSPSAQTVFLAYAFS
jgi:hypothetical protein